MEIWKVPSASWMGTWKAAFVEAFLAGDFIFSTMSLFIFPPAGVIFTPGRWADV